MDEKPVLVDLREGYRVLTLNRPQRLNAFNEAMHVALAAALHEAEADLSCRASSAARVRALSRFWPSRFPPRRPRNGA